MLEVLNLNLLFPVVISHDSIFTICGDLDFLRLSQNCSAQT